jgi:hypothetical protein
MSVTVIPDGKYSRMASVGILMSVPTLRCSAVTPAKNALIMTEGTIVSVKMMTTKRTPTTSVLRSISVLNHLDILIMILLLTETPPAGQVPALMERRLHIPAIAPQAMKLARSSLVNSKTKPQLSPLA